MERINLQSKGNSECCYWQYVHQPLKLGKPEKDEDTEVVIIGDGLAAVSIAYNLIRSGKKVVVVSENGLGTSGSGRTNSHLLTAIDDRYHRLEKIFGTEKTKLIAESHKAAIDQVERISAELGIDCEFERVDGFLFLHPSDNTHSLSLELKAARNAGVSVTDLPFVLGTNKHIPCLKFHDQAQFHPMKYITGLCEAFRRAGGVIYSNVEIATVDRSGVLLKDGQKISARQIVLSSSEDEVLKHRKYRTYTLVAKIRKNSVRKFLWWDTGDKKESKDFAPYHYVRIQRYNEDHDLLICGGQSHRVENTGQDQEERFVKLEAWMRERYPAQEIIYRWTAEGSEPGNYIGFIGKKPGEENIYVVSGDSGHGVMNAAIAGMIIPDLINGKPNKFTGIYDPSASVPSRFATVVNDFVKDTVSVVKKGISLVYQYSPARNLTSVIMQDIRPDKDPRENNFTEGLHSEGAIFWNNDEESWDRIQRKKNLSLNQK